MSLSYRRFFLFSVLLLQPFAHASELARNFQDRLAEQIQNAAESQQPGVAAILFGRQLSELSRQQALQLALRQSPQILANGQSRIIAESQLIQQSAGFDWVLGLSTSLTQTDFNERSEQITRERVTALTIDGNSIDNAVEDPADDNETGEDGVPVAIADSVGNLLCITVAGEIVNEEQCALQTEVTTQEEFASGDADSTNAWTLAADTGKQFDIGSRIQFGLGISRRTKNFYPLDDLGLIRAVSNSDPIGNGSRYPWTSRIFVEYLTPLPFGKNYGLYGSAASLGRELARINNQRSRFSERSIEESLLLQVDDAYWNHVRSSLRLQSSINTKNNLLERLESADRQFRARSLTNYELSQVQSAVARSRANEQAAWVAFIDSAERLGGLLDMDSDTLIVPAGFHETLAETAILGGDETLKTVLSDNPGINASRVTVQSNETLVKNAEQNFKPDISLVLSLELSQSDRVLGYEDLGDSLSNVFDPDNTIWFLGLQYKLPFGKNAERARRHQTEISLTQARNNVILDEIDLSSQANSLLARNNASLRLSNEAEQRLRLAEAAFERAQVARNRGSISEFEFLFIVNDLDAARVAWIDRLVEQQRIESSLLALQGKLADEMRAGQ